MMTRKPGYRPYEPQLKLVPWGDEIWTVEGPEVVYRLAGVGLPCPTRMTVVRLSGNRLWLHSPVAFCGSLAAAIWQLGEISAIVAPNSYHHLHVGLWACATPDVEIHASPDLLGKSNSGNDWTKLGSIPAAAWDGELDQCLVDLGSYQEVVFFHRRSRTLIVTDLMQNFEANRVANPLTRLVLKAGGATGPVGSTSVEIRLAATRHRAKLSAAVEQMREWKPDSIVLSHGRCFRADALAELERAFAWADPIHATVLPFARGDKPSNKGQRDRCAKNDAKPNR